MKISTDFSTRICVATLSLLLTGQALAQQTHDSVFSFRGATLGDSLPAAYKLPRCQREAGLGSETCMEPSTIGDLRVWTLLQLVDRRLARVLVTFESNKTTEMTAVLSAMYGPPSLTVVDTMQNRFGAKFIGARAIWHLRSGPLQLGQYGTSITQGYWAAQDSTLIALYDQRKAEKAAAAAADLRRRP
jgi:hypothetical protein